MTDPFTLSMILIVVLALSGLSVGLAMMSGSFLYLIMKDLVFPRGLIHRLRLKPCFRAYSTAIRFLLFHCSFLPQIL